METPGSRTKQDLGWKYCEMLKVGAKIHIKCVYCGKIIKGGGIFRLKEHLAGRKGNGAMCLKVPTDVRLLMQQTLEANSAKGNSRQKQSLVADSGLFDTPQSQVIIMPSTRQKKDLAWMHCQMLKNNGKVHIKCNYCAKMFKGGGIHRFKEHLAGRKGASPICFHVPPDVRLLMEQSLNEVVGKQKRQKLIPEEAKSGASPATADLFGEDGNDYDADNDNVDVSGVPISVEPINLPLNEEDGINHGHSITSKRGRGNTSAIVDPTVPLNAVNLDMKDHPIHMTIGRFLYDIGANLDTLDSIYFQQLIDMISSRASGLLAPSHHELRGWILKNLVEETKNDIDQYRTTWAKTGCSILVEEWNSESGKTLLNFLVDCPQGTVFLKSVDASHFIYSTDGLYALLKQVVEEVGAANVMQVITNGEEHYNVVGKRLMDTFNSLYWAPCVLRCVDLILEDFGKLEWINAVIEQARSVTKFIYNHSAVMNLMRKFTFGKDIVQQGLTRSATNFTMLQRMADFKLNLQNMVTSQEWMDCPYAKQLGGLTMLDIISNRSFWSSCILIIRLTSPLLRLLGIASSKKKAAMGYVLAGIYRVKETIKRELVKREDYIIYWNIIDHRWNQQQHPPLHAAGFFLNPKFFYSIEGDVHNEIQSRMFDCIERLVPDLEVQDKIVKELNLYKNAVGDLGRKMAVRSRETLLPGEEISLSLIAVFIILRIDAVNDDYPVATMSDLFGMIHHTLDDNHLENILILSEWWSTYGGGCPNLAHLALRILNQTCSSVGCRHNHIPFEKVYATKNCLEQKRVSDLVFVQYNLRLRGMADENKNQISRDPISFDNISIVEDWIMQNDLCLEDYESSDWMSLVPSYANNMPAGVLVDEIEDLGVGFSDFEIFDGLKDFM